MDRLNFISEAAIMLIGKAIEGVIFLVLMAPVFLFACFIAKILVPQSDLPDVLLGRLGIQ